VKTRASSGIAGWAVSTAALLAISGCSLHRDLGPGAITGALVGAAALGTAGGVITNNVNPPFTDQDSDRAVGIVVGAATGAIVGGLIGHAFFEPEAPTVEPPAAPPVVPEKIVLRGVHFAFDSAVLRPEAAPILGDAVAVLRENPNLRVEIRGYTDDVGAAGYNQTLSLARADAVRVFLQGEGIAADRLSVEGFGKSDPIAPNDTPAGRAQNRRVEIVPLP
jgi:OOP family OmpA-OmpF porin